MPNVGDILRFTSCGSLFDQQVCNVFYYLVSVWTGNLTLSQMAAAFDAAVLDTIAQAIVDDMEWSEIKIDNLDDPAEQHTEPVTTAGVLTGNPLPSYVAATFKLVRTTAATRHGSKRIAGIAEENVTDNTLSLATAGTNIETVLAAELDSGSDMTLTPVIVGRNPDGSLNLSVVNPISSAQVSPNISTQNSRKVGHGT